MEIEQGDLVDPPSGWKYGFPKPWDGEPGETVDSWLERRGYPEREILYWRPIGMPIRIIKKHEPPSN